MTFVRPSKISWSSPGIPALDLNGPTIPFRPFPEDWVDRPVVDLFRSAAEEFGDRVACEDLTERLTYAQVWAACRRLAFSMEAAVPAGQPVGVLLPNDAAYAVAVLACLAANRPCVMIDRHYPEDRVAAIVRDAALAAIVLRRSDIASRPPLPAGIRLLAIDDALEGRPVPDQLSGPPMPSGAAAFVLYTSGSTGRPKGIALSQRAVLHRVGQLINAVHLRPDDKLLSLSSSSTIAGLQHIFEVILTGGTLVKLDLQRTGLGRVVQIVAERGITLMFATPAVWRHVAGIDDIASALTSLRCIHSSGDALLTIDLEWIRRVLPADCHVLSSYGATEAPALLQWFVPPRFPVDGPRVPTGYPLDGFAYAVLDDSGTAAQEGELLVKSAWMSLGIWRHGAVQPGPFEHGRGDGEAPVYRTGDVARRRDDGLFVMMGRKDRQVKILGNRVELAEIETVLRQMSRIADAAVIARRVEGEARLFAFFVPRETDSPDIVARVRGHLKERLPAYMQPSHCFAIGKLPLLPGRKIDEEALLAHAVGHAPTTLLPSSQPPAARATQRSIEMVNKAWRRAFGRPPPGDDRNFDEAGGDSLRLLLLVLYLEQSCGRALALDRFHGELRPAEFALALDRLLEGRSPMEPDGSPNVFFVPGRRGDTPHFARFRMACTQGIRIHATTYPDLHRLARGGFEDIVAHTVDEIEQVAPEGPILLAGYSLGGDVAYAVADRLRRRGRTILALLVLDTNAEAYAQDDRPGEARHWADRVATLLRLVRIGDWRTILERSLTPSAVARPVTRYAIRFLTSFSIPIHAGFVFYLRWHLRAMLVETHRTAWVKGTPAARLDIPVILFRAEDSRGDLGWHARARSLTIVPVAGDHVTMLDRENSSALIAEFVRAVHTASNRNPGAPDG